MDAHKKAVIFNSERVFFIDWTKLHLGSVHAYGLAPETTFIRCRITFREVITLSTRQPERYNNYILTGSIVF